MVDERMASPGPAGAVLMDNIRRIREGSRVTYVELSGRLAHVGRPIPVLGLRRIERGERRVDVDDLLALAHVLGVAPVDLLVPNDWTDENYPVTTEVGAPADVSREWICGQGFLSAAPPSPSEIAETVRWMPRARASAVVVKLMIEAPERSTS